MAIEPIKGFYVHDEVTDTDGVAKVAPEAIEGGLYSTSRNINTANVGNYNVTNSGNITEANTFFGMGEFVPCESDALYTATFYDVPEFENGATGFNAYFCFKDGDGAYLGRTTVPMYGEPHAVFKSPATATKISVNTYKSGGISDTGKIQIEKGTRSTEYVEPITANDGTAREVTNKTKNLVENEIDITENAGYWSTSGHVNAQGETTKEVYTDIINVTNYSEVYWSLFYSQNHPIWIACATYDENGAFIERVNVFSSGSTQILASTGTFTWNSNVKYVSFTYRTYDDTIFSASGLVSLSNLVELPTGEIINNKTRSSLAVFPLRFKPFYDHLFVNNSGDDISIPHESLYHVRISRLFGFNTIEANVAKTSDGVFIVNHLNGGKFGRYFHHVDGITDISDIAINSVTWEWVEQNVRYNSTIPQYRTRPCTLNEFLSECRQQNIIPFVTSSDPDAVEIAKNIMGVSNYIAYGGDRATNPDAIIYHWVTRTTKQDIIDYCESIGKPFIYGMANPTAFSDYDLQDIVDTLHDMGYWIGTSYVDSLWCKYSYMGFDVNGTQKQVNRIDNGNVCNYNSMFGFDDFTFTNATESNGILTFSADGTLSPKNLPNTNGIYAFDLEIEFVGDITVPAIGEWNEAVSYNSDGASPVFLCVPIINNVPALSISVISGTVVKDIKYKLSKI